MRYIYIYTTRIAVQREKREYGLAQARACFGHARAAPLFALHCVYISTNGGLFERVYWIKINRKLIDGIGKLSKKIT